MNKHLLLVQPRFSQPGHFAHFTLLHARALSEYVSLKVLVYTYHTDATYEAIINQLCEIAETEVIRGSQAGWRIGTKILYQHTLKIIKQNPDVKQVLFLDPSVMTLATGLVLKPLPKDCYMTATEIFGPELYLEDNFLKVGLKRLLFQVATRYRRLRIAPLTPELSDSWRASGLISPEACLDLPTVQMANAQSPSSKSPIGNRTDLTFAIVGSLREQKNIERIAPLFRDGLAPGTLFLAGAARNETTAAYLAQVVDEAAKRIVCDIKFLSEPELDSLVSQVHYNLLLYVGWDERMESGMVFTSARSGTPIIGLRGGWVGRMIDEYGLGYTIDPYNVDEIRACLTHCALPGSPEYRRFEAGLRQMLADYRHEVVGPKFVAALGLGSVEDIKSS